MTFKDLLTYHQRQLKVILKDGNVVEGQILSQRFKNDHDTVKGYERELMNITVYGVKDGVLVNCDDIKEIIIK